VGHPRTRGEGRRWWVEFRFAPGKPFGSQSGIQEQVNVSLRLCFPASMLILVLAAAAAATPIQPDLEKLLSKPHSEQEWFEPARAGWDGPETESSGFSRSAFALRSFGPAETARAARASFLAAAVPDPRIWACVCMLILLLRRLKRATPKPTEASQSSTVEVERAA
jgi:hypothetical protein